MAISHICQQCGFDLAATRPIHDPYYRLPIVICPECAASSVRMKHPMQRWWKRLIRIDTVATAFVVHLHLVAASTAVTVFGAFGLPVLIAAVLAGEIEPAELAAPSVLVGCFLIALGAWLTAGFSHIARWRAFIGWALFVVFVMTIVLLFMFLAEANIPRPGELREPRDATFGDRLFIAGFVWSVGVLIVTITAALATIGIPAGFGLRALARTFRRYRWRMRLKYRRRARFS